MTQHQTWNEAHIEALKAQVAMSQSERDEMFDVVLNYLEGYPIRWVVENPEHFCGRCEAYFKNLESLLENLSV